MKVSILDCTLRDGGYINNWEFGKRHIEGIISGLTVAKIDIVECGFLQDKPCTLEQSLYGSISEIEQLLPGECGSTEYVAMINCGGFDLSKLCADGHSRVSAIRVVFHEHQMDAAVEECRIIMDKGYKAFLQPMGTDAYTDKAILNLIEKANEIRPYAFYFVDSLGVMGGDDIIRMALLIHNNLDSGIVMGFHSHNNMQLAFSNVQRLINMRQGREIIVDSSTYGMGRGAGNLHTELIANYMNENYGANYNVDQILRVYDDHIRSIRAEYEWGYSAALYLAAIHKCHPNYSTYLVSRATLPITDIGVLLSRIPGEYKRIYSQELIDKLYVEYVSSKVDDEEAYALLQMKLQNKPLLILGIGKTMITHARDIERFIEENTPAVISINHVPEQYSVDFAFYSNKKRFEERAGTEATHILTSNIEHNIGTAVVVDYMTLCNCQGKFIDNAAILLLSLLHRLGYKSVNVAGLDGYSGSDYYKKELVTQKDAELMERTNKIVTEAIKQYSGQMDIRFITPSLYQQE